MIIRPYQESDIDRIVTLFYETVHSVNTRDYSKEQVEAWAPYQQADERKAAWQASLRRNFSFVAEENGVIVGFSDLSSKGYLDRMFVHKDHQGRGIASALLRRLELEATARNLPVIETDASITARAFFEARGYTVVREQTVERSGVKLNNYRMEKRFAPASAKTENAEGTGEMSK
ncbi:GNAT family N-acetyltransferase [Paenibacillus sp. CN-4]|uniref:GNAT family N-acetyltransferase n=1 Tax=Paenibacillus nanchangensis TaxID=3348343 RepID=UPI00397950A4